MELSPSPGTLDPIFISVKEAARAISVSTWTLYQLLDTEPPAIESRYQGRRRLVDVASLREYARNLPTEAPVKDAAS